MGRRRPPRERPRAARVAEVAGGVLLVLALALTGVRLVVLDEGRFAAAAARATGTASVSQALGDLVADRLIAAEPDAATVEPVVRSVTAAAVRSGAAAALVSTAARQLHRTAVAGRPDTAVLRLGDLGLLAVQSLRRLSPDVARRIPADVDATLVALEEGPASEAVAAVADAARTVRWASWAASALAVLALLAAVLLRRDRTAGVRRVGVVVAAAGAATVVLNLLVRAAVVDAVVAPDARAAGRAAYDAFLGPVATLGTAAVAVGLLLVVAVAALGRRASLTGTARARLAAALDDDRGRRALAGAAAVTGLLLLVDRDLVARTAATLGGIGLLVAGLEGLLRSATVPRDASADPEPPRATPVASAPGRRGGRAVPVRARVPVALVVVVLAGAVVALLTGRSLDDATARTERCNGSAALCALRLDQVVLPATHNAYSSSRDGFLLANQQTGIEDQLEGGVRGFLIDTHEGQRVGDRVLTRLPPDGSSRTKIEDAIGPDATRTALRLRARMGDPSGVPVRPYLCHGFCELGAVDLEDALRGIRDFLLAHPDDVVVLSVEDEAPPATFVAAMRDSGLLDLTWRGALRPMPTLGQLVRSGGRVVVLVENDTGGVPWLHAQFAVTQETPYDLTTREALLGDEGCAANRGGPDAPLFLLNHFLGTVPPRPSAARTVNDRAALLAHVDRCRRLRGRTPTLLAVDFWRTGDVVGAARELNRRAVGAAGG